MIALPSLTALDRAQAVRIWLATEPTDRRRGFDRLAEQARQVSEQDPMGGHLFVFRSRRGDRLKILLWDRAFNYPQVSAIVGGGALTRRMPSQGRHLLWDRLQR